MVDMRVYSKFSEGKDKVWKKSFQGDFNWPEAFNLPSLQVVSGNCVWVKHVYRVKMRIEHTLSHQKNTHRGIKDMVNTYICTFINTNT